jgi:hypothetical protein
MLVDRARSTARTQMESQGERLSGGLQTMASQIQALASGRTDEAGPAADYARQAGDMVSQWADRLQSGGLDGLLSDMKTFARRRPMAFLAGAALAGFAVGRLGAAARAAGSESHDEGALDLRQQSFSALPGAPSSAPDPYNTAVVVAVEDDIIPVTAPAGIGAPDPLGATVATPSTERIPGV